MADADSTDDLALVAGEVEDTLTVEYGLGLKYSEGLAGKCAAPVNEVGVGERHGIGPSQSMTEPDI